MCYRVGISRRYTFWKRNRKLLSKFRFIYFNHALSLTLLTIRKVFFKSEWKLSSLLISSHQLKFSSIFVYHRCNDLSYLKHCAWWEKKRLNEKNDFVQFLCLITFAICKCQEGPPIMIYQSFMFIIPSNNEAVYLFRNFIM